MTYFSLGKTRRHGVGCAKVKGELNEIAWQEIGLIGRRRSSERRWRDPTSTSIQTVRFERQLEM